MPEDTEQLIADLQRMGEENMRLKAQVAELEARLAEEVKDRDHWKALAESLSYPMPE